ncbi:MAG TPA: peptide ABC transporter substrate-binding protein [Candidatus Aquilonibacter sp.]|nr:peptide ABC transporter substrate-binding protein [Candidatus Aquilonibacter sp.]
MRRTALILALLGVLCGCTRVTGVAEGHRHSYTIPHVLRVADLAEPDHLNPYLTEMDIGYAFSSLVYSYLIVSNDEGKLIGDLATDVPTIHNGGISADGRTYTYHLRRGVTWHDGKPFTAQDVVASWKAVVDPHNLTLFRQGYDVVESITTPDPYTAVVHLKKRYPAFVSQFFAPLQEGGKPILPAHILAQERDFNKGRLNTHPIGTGPFKFASWKHGERITLVRNDAYFRGRPKLARIVMTFVPDLQTILMQMRLHQIDLIYTPSPPLMSQYRALPDAKVWTAPWNSQLLVVMNTGKPGLDDERVRRAIVLATDRQSMIDHVTSGVGEPAYDVIAPTAIGYVKRAPIPYDVRQANQLLDAAGWKRGSDGVRAKDGARLDFTIVTIAGSTMLNRMAVLMQESLRAAGIALEIKPYPYNQIFDFNGPIDTYRFDMAIYGTALSWDPDSHVYYGCDQWYPNGQNYYRYCNHEYDRLEAAGLKSDDPAVRAPLYAKADAILWNTVAYMPIDEVRRINVTSPDLKNYKVNPTSTPWYNAWQWDI